uniref:DUF4231 domain-containing protein n=2 Tax=Macrostomum lignano TaxID=282301 RepID=A0A1I8IE18_9PLAT
MHRGQTRRFRRVSSCRPSNAPSASWTSLRPSCFEYRDADRQVSKLPHCQQFVCLGGLQTMVLDVPEDLARRRGLAWVAFRFVRAVLQSEALPDRQRAALFKAVIETVLLYNTETWTLTDSLEQQVNAAHAGLSLRSAASTSPMRAISPHWPLATSSEPSPKVHSRCRKCCCCRCRHPTGGDRHAVCVSSTSCRLMPAPRTLPAVRPAVRAQALKRQASNKLGMDEQKRKELENKAIDLMRNVAQRKNLFQLREGDGRLGSIDRLMPDFYAIFSSNSRLAYMQQWSTFETIIIVVPMAVLLLAALISISSKLAQIALDLLVSLSVSCSHIWQHGVHLSQQTASADNDNRSGNGRELPPPLRMIRWLDDKGVASAWDVMRLPRPDNRAERLRQLASSLRRMREERNALQKRRSILKEGPPDHR